MKSFFTSSIEVLRYDWTKYGRMGSGYSYGSGYCLDQGTRQKLVKRYRLFNHIIWTKMLDAEDVPMFAIIDKACLGSTDWKSKFSKHIK